MIVYLIGARGSGKTTVGHLLSARLGYPFIDLDEFLCASQGESVAQIVGREGWTGFRKLESQQLRKACASAENGNLVVATGGGVPMEANNRAFMRASGKVVWLNAPCAAILERLERDPLAEQRPPLTGRTTAEETEEIVRTREPVYRECCHFEVNAEADPDGICDLTLAFLTGRPNGS